MSAVLRYFLWLWPVFRSWYSRRAHVPIDPVSSHLSLVCAHLWYLLTKHTSHAQNLFMGVFSFWVYLRNFEESFVFCVCALWCLISLFLPSLILRPIMVHTAERSGDLHFLCTLWIVMVFSPQIPLSSVSHWIGSIPLILTTLLSIVCMFSLCLAISLFSLQPLILELSLSQTTSDVVACSQIVLPKQKPSQILSLDVYGQFWCFLNMFTNVYRQGLKLILLITPNTG